MSELEDAFEMAMREVPAGWDVGPLEFSRRLRELLQTISDEGTAVDIGGGDGVAHLWVTVSGTEFFITAEKSHKQTRSEAH